MWFDPRAALAEIEGRPPANPANPANRPRGPTGQFAGFAGFATPDAPEAKPAPGRAPAGFAGFAGFATPPAPASAPRADGLDADAGALLDWLRRNGPATYGAAASSLGWGATRAWQAEARLRAAGLVTVTGPLGVAVPVEAAP